MVRVRFGGAITRKDWLEARLWLKRRADHPTLFKTESYGPLGYGLHFRITRPEEIDAELETLMREAYRIGQQEEPGR